jgi:hypothetical protein
MLSVWKPHKYHDGVWLGLNKCLPSQSLLIYHPPPPPPQNKKKKKKKREKNKEKEKEKK